MQLEVAVRYKYINRKKGTKTNNKLYCIHVDISSNPHVRICQRRCFEISCTQSKIIYSAYFPTHLLTAEQAFLKHWEEL